MLKKITMNSKVILTLSLCFLHTMPCQAANLLGAFIGLFHSCIEQYATCIPQQRNGINALCMTIGVLSGWQAAQGGHLNTTIGSIVGVGVPATLTISSISFPCMGYSPLLFDPNKPSNQIKIGQHTRTIASNVGAGFFFGLAAKKLSEIHKNRSTASQPEKLEKLSADSKNQVILENQTPFRF